MIAENEDATVITICEPGFARGEAFYNDGDNKFIECRKCDWKQGKYQTDTGQAECKDVPDGSFVGMCIW